MEAVEEALLENPNYQRATLTLTINTGTGKRTTYKANFVPGQNNIYYDDDYYAQNWECVSGDEMASTFSYYVGLPANVDIFGGTVEVKYYLSGSGFQTKFSASVGVPYSYVCKYNKYAYLTSFDASSKELDINETIKITYSK